MLLMHSEEGRHALLQEGVGDSATASLTIYLEHGLGCGHNTGGC